MSITPLKILVTSVSKKVPLVRELKKALNRVCEENIIVGADAEFDCVAKHFVDDFWQMPQLSELSDDELINYLQQAGINGIIPTRDGELMFFATRKQLLKKHNINLMLAPENAVQICLDKKLFSEQLIRQNFSVIPAVLPSEIEQLDCTSYVVKERFGAGSQSILIDVKKQAAIEHAKQLDSAIIQPFIEGDEYSIDVFFSRNSNCKGVVVRRRDLVINGESQITSTVYEPAIAELCNSVAKHLKLTGHAVFQVIKTLDGAVHIIELNSRFGGASTLSIAAGLDSFYWFALETMGESIDEHGLIYPDKSSFTGLRQIRYAVDEIVEI